MPGNALVLAEREEILVGILEDRSVRSSKTLTWDQGMEMARWQHTQDSTGVTIYFCHPHSPWQRPSNENANRLIRYWLPKRTDLYRHSQGDLDRVAHIINTTPRRLHKWRTARAVYDDQTVALTM